MGLLWACRAGGRRRGRARLGQTPSGSVASRGRRPRGGNKRMAGLEWARLALVSGWVGSFHHFSSPDEDEQCLLRVLKDSSVERFGETAPWEVLIN